jgi:hypothetical protein
MELTIRLMPPFRQGLKNFSGSAAPIIGRLTKRFQLTPR